jgi:fucose 4-O-acetylase-like acetyltransferase
MERHSTVDTFRLLAAFAVVILHVSMGDIPYDRLLYIRLAARFAVPFFFIASGYFFYFSYQKAAEQAMNKSFLKLFSIYLISSLIYLPKAMLQHTFRIDESIVLRGTGTHLWFLPSLMFGLFVVWYTIHYFKGYWALLVNAVIFTAPVYVYYYYNNGEGKLIDVDFARFILSAGFLSVGLLIARYKINFSVITSSLITLLGFALLFVEIHLLKQYRNVHIYDIQFSFSCVIISLGLFLLSFRIPGSARISNIGKEMSLGIYLYHPLVNMIIFNVIIHLSGSYSGLVLMFNPLICFFGTLFALMILKKIYPKLFAVLNGDFSPVKRNKTA